MALYNQVAAVRGTSTCKDTVRPRPLKSNAGSGRSTIHASSLRRHYPEQVQRSAPAKCPLSPVSPSSRTLSLAHRISPLHGFSHGKPQKRTTREASPIDRGRMGLPRLRLLTLRHEGEATMGAMDDRTRISGYGHGCMTDRLTVPTFALVQTPHGDSGRLGRPRPPQIHRSAPRWKTTPDQGFRTGGGEGIRTLGLCVANV